MERKSDNIFKRLDWCTVILFALLAIMGWLAICGSTHSYIDTSFAEFFNQDERSGKQAMWMGISLLCGSIMLCVPKHTYRNLSVILYGGAIARAGCGAYPIRPMGEKRRDFYGLF